MPAQRKIFASPQDVEAAFYEALEHADLDAMMAVWAEDEEIICVHPGGPRLIGYKLIRAAWQHIFSHGNRFSVRIVQQTAYATPFVVTSSVLAQVTPQSNKSVSAPVAATNVFVRGPLGWRMVAHHASGVPPASVDETPTTLH